MRGKASLQFGRRLSVALIKNWRGTGCEECQGLVPSVLLNARDDTRITAKAITE